MKSALLGVRSMRRVHRCAENLFLRPLLLQAFIFVCYKKRPEEFDMVLDAEERISHHTCWTQFIAPLRGADISKSTSGESEYWSRLLTARRRTLPNRLGSEKSARGNCLIMLLKWLIRTIPDSSALKWVSRSMKGCRQPGVILLVLRLKSDGTRKQKTRRGRRSRGSKSMLSYYRYRRPCPTKR